MKKADELRIKVDELQNQIENLIRNFIDENGECTVKIEVETTYIKTGYRQSKLTSVDVNVSVNI